MKEVWMVLGFGAGMLAGALIFKHCDEAKNLVDKGENAVRTEVENLKQSINQGAGKKSGANSDKQNATAQN